MDLTRLHCVTLKSTNWKMLRRDRPPCLLVSFTRRSETQTIGSQPLFSILTLQGNWPFTSSPYFKPASLPAKPPRCRFPPHCAGMSEGNSGMSEGILFATAAVGVKSDRMRSLSLLKAGTFLHPSAACAPACVRLFKCVTGRRDSQNSVSHS